MKEGSGDIEIEITGITGIPLFLNVEGAVYGSISSVIEFLTNVVKIAASEEQNKEAWERLERKAEAELRKKMKRWKGRRTLRVVEVEERTVE